MAASARGRIAEMPTRHRLRAECEIRRRLVSVRLQTAKGVVALLPLYIGLLEVVLRLVELAVDDVLDDYGAIEPTLTTDHQCSFEDVEVVDLVA